RRNSPSVTTGRPTSSCRRTTSAIDWSSISRRARASISPFFQRSRACRSLGGRRRLPTWSARKKGFVIALLLLLQLFPRVLHRGREHLELHVGELAVHLAHFAQVFGLHDVARLRVDGDRPARAVGILPGLEDGHRLVRVDPALLLLDRLEDERGAVPGA